MNTNITFRAESGRILRGKDYLRFVASGVLGMIATTTTLVVLSNLMPEIAAKLGSIVAGFVVNFTMSHFCGVPAEAVGRTTALAVGIVRIRRETRKTIVSTTHGLKGRSRTVRRRSTEPHQRGDAPASVVDGLPNDPPPRPPARLTVHPIAQQTALQHERQNTSIRRARHDYQQRLKPKSSPGPQNLNRTRHRHEGGQNAHRGQGARSAGIELAEAVQPTHDHFDDMTLCTPRRS